jgi:hypothetical protein
MNLRRYFCCICDYYEKKRIYKIYRELNIEEFYSNDGDIIGVTTAVL